MPGPLNNVTAIRTFSSAVGGGRREEADRVFRVRCCCAGAWTAQGSRRRWRRCCRPGRQSAVGTVRGAGPTGVAIVLGVANSSEAEQLRFCHGPLFGVAALVSTARRTLVALDEAAVVKIAKVRARVCRQV